MPLISLVIPTLQRPDTLRHALATAAAQDFADFEVVVQNNGADPAVARVVREHDDPRIRLYETPDVVPMSQNWEIALDNARGAYVAFIGDDDGFLPDACAIAARAIAMSGAEIVSWHPFIYYWPDYPEPGRRNRLMANADSRLRMVRCDPRGLLRQVYRWRLDYWRLPMIYNSFIARSVVDRVRARVGRYFVGLAPDVASGVVNAAVAREFIRMTRPLSVVGLSRHSTGHSNFIHRLPRRDEASFARDFGPSAMDARLAGVVNLHTFLANDFLAIQSRLLADDPTIVFDFRGLVAAMARAINDTRGAYEATFAAVRAIAAQHGIDLSRIHIPARVDSPAVLTAQATPSGEHSVYHIVDGDAASLGNIADAVALVRGLTPQAAALDLDIQAEPPPREFARVAADGLLGFAADGNGVQGLCDGWSEPEPWGTWAVESPAILQIAIDQSPRPCVVDLACRVLLLDGNDRVALACTSNGTRLGEWIFAEGIAQRTVRFELPLDASAPGGIVALELTVDRLRSPAKLGLSDDARTLGVGVEYIRIAACSAG